LADVTWVDVTSAALADETVVGATVGETTVVVVNAAGRWHALEAWCTHAECPLTDGWVEGAAIRCACHGALFDLETGAPLEGPAEQPVRVFPVRVAGGRVEVNA